MIDDQQGKNDKDKGVNSKGKDLFGESITIKIGPLQDHDVVGVVCNLVISVDCSLNYSHHKYNTKLHNRVKEME